MSFYIVHFCHNLSVLEKKRDENECKSQDKLKKEGTSSFILISLNA